MQTITDSLVPILSIFTPILLMILGFLGAYYVKSVDKRFEKIDEQFTAQTKRADERDELLNKLNNTLNSTSAVSQTERGYVDRDLQELKETMKELNNKMEIVLGLHLGCPARSEYEHKKK